MKTFEVITNETCICDNTWMIEAETLEEAETKALQLAMEGALPRHTEYRFIFNDPKVEEGSSSLIVSSNENRA